MDFFQDKVAIVTGGASGIGKALCEELARRGSQVILSDINGKAVKEIAAAIRKDGYKAEGVVLDVADYDAVKKMVDKAVKDFGRLDYMFNNAGTAVAGEAKDVTIKDWRHVLDINLYGVVNGAVSAYAVMVEQGFGHIVNTASIEGLVPLPVTSSYCASKHGVVGLSSALRLEGADLGVKVSVVCPGHIKTNIFAASKDVNMDFEQLMKGYDFIAISPEKCAEVVLNGVKRNKAIIVVTRAAKLMWALQRISPNLFIWGNKMQMKSFRKKVLKKT